ncbi:MAG: response regulator [Bacteroidia bacterium]
MITLAIVDDKQPNRESLANKIQSISDLKVCFLAENGEDFLDKMKKCNQKPQVVLMDIDMPVMDGIEAVEVCKEIYPQVKCIMLTVFDDDEKIFDAIRAGAIGYLLKDENIEKITNSIKEAVEFEGAPMSPRIARKAMHLLSRAKVDLLKAEPTDLSDREMDILRAMVQGLDYREIGEKLFISPHTVRTHISNIYKKLHVSGKTHAVKLAMKNRWV